MRMTNLLDPTRTLRFALGVLFVAAGVAHFVMPDFFDHESLAFH
jgi:uncharacterized membrane protein